MSIVHDSYVTSTPKSIKTDVKNTPSLDPPLNLIQKSLQYAKEERIWFLNLNFGITEPLTPKARRNVQYLLIREYIMTGCRKASKLVLDHYKRSQAYGILVDACMTIFNCGVTDDIMNLYNGLLDTVIGTH